MIEDQEWNDAFNRYFKKGTFPKIKPEQKAFMIGYLAALDHSRAFDMLELIKKVKDFVSNAELIGEIEMVIKNSTVSKTNSYAKESPRHKPYFSKWSKELEANLNDIEFLPEKPYQSEIISSESLNLWELHELHPSDQIIGIRIKDHQSKP